MDALNSPTIIVSQYRSADRQMSLPSTGGLSQSSTWLLNPQWQPSGKVSHRPTPTPTPALTCLDDIGDVMDNYRNLVFEFTFPDTVDFYDVFAGELACTQRSLIVAEYGRQLWDILRSLQAMRVQPGEDQALAKGVRKVERSLEDLQFWVEGQRVTQLRDIEMVLG